MDVVDVDVRTVFTSPLSVVKLIFVMTVAITSVVVDVDFVVVSVVVNIVEYIIVAVDLDIVQVVVVPNSKPFLIVMSLYIFNETSCFCVA